MVSPAQAARSIDRLADELDRPAELAQAIADAVLGQARRRAAGRPTPQARMAASGLIAARGSIIAPAGRIVRGRGGSPFLGDVIGGAEFGSSIYPQFGPRRSGAFLSPSTAEAEKGEGPAMVAGEHWLDDLIDEVI